MTASEDKIVEIKKYLKKLTYTIEQQAVFKFMNLILVDKNRIDDLLCCIEGTFPEQYRQIIKRDGMMAFDSYMQYTQLTRAIKNKFILSSSVYSVKYPTVKNIIKQLPTSFTKDFNKLGKTPN